MMQAISKLLLIVCLVNSAAYAQQPAEKQIKAWQQQAKRVTIIRDNWGVPHIYGKTDADCIFGLAYAQAEDNIEQVEDNFIRAIGRGAEVHGEESLLSDQVVHALELVKLSRKEYQDASSTMKGLYDSYAAGLNYYLYKNKQYTPAMLQKFEAWYPLALIRHFYYFHDILQIAGVSATDLKANFAVDPDTHTTGSNAWAIGKEKTGSKSSMLFLNPHRPVFGNGTFNEAHIESESGWKFSGATKFGFPLLYMGHNGSIGYGYTVNYADIGDQYIETFDHPSDKLMYKYGNTYKKAAAWQQTITIKKGNDKVQKVFSFLKTHHGPVLKKLNGKPITVRLANIEKQGWFEQWYHMSKANNLASFKKALATLAMPYLNVLYGDKEGNIFFLYNLASGKRKAGIDFLKPVDGSNPETEWQGYHAMTELPQLTNPPSGFLQSCNSDAAYTAGEGSIKKTVFPIYMRGTETKNPRAARSLAILENNENITFDKWTKFATDTYSQLADDSLKIILQILEKDISAEKKDFLLPLFTTLQQWNGHANVESVGMTLFREMINYHRGEGLSFMPSLEKTKNTLEKHWGRWQVKWGERLRVQNIGWNEKQMFNDNKPSFPLPGAPQNYGTIFCSSYGNSKSQQTPSDAKIKYITQGNTYTSVIEIGDTVRSRSIMPFGQQETGPHSNDQTPLYIKGEFKDAWFYKRDVLKHAKRTYHPGE